MKAVPWRAADTDVDSGLAESRKVPQLPKGLKSNPLHFTPKLYIKPIKFEKSRL